MSVLKALGAETLLGGAEGRAKRGREERGRGAILGFGFGMRGVGGIALEPGGFVPRGMGTGAGLSGVFVLKVL